DPSATERQLSSIADKQKGAWIFLYATGDYDPAYFVPTWLTTHAYQSFDDWAVSGRLQYYRFAADAALTAQSTSLTFGSSLSLDRYRWLTGDVDAGEAVAPDLQWRRQAQESRRPRVGPRVGDGHGRT